MQIKLNYFFIKCTPDNTLAFKYKKCSGNKRSEEQLTLLLSMNMTDTDKLNPSLIGTSKKSRCFVSVYTANKRASMPSELFAECLL